MANPDRSEPAHGPELAPANWGHALINWLVPGLGFVAIGHVARGVTVFLIVMVTFGLGLVLHGGVAWPSWTPAAEDFNLINNFTFIIQTGAGLPALASLGANLVHWEPLGGTPQHPYFDLGAYYIVVAGAINYFAVCNLYDRHIRPRAAGGGAERGGGQEKHA